MGERNGGTAVLDSTAALQGLDPGRISVYEQYYKELVKKKKLQGAAYMAVKDGQLAGQGAWGKRDFRAGRKPLKLDSIGDIYEVTMAFTVVAVLQLMEQGRLSLQQPAAHFLSELDHPYFHEIKIIHLLTHTSGLTANPHELGEPYPLPHYAWNSWFKGGWLQTVLSFPLIGRPGERYAFSSSGYAVLGGIVEHIAGQPIERYITEHVLKPLQLHDTHYIVPPEKMERAIIAQQYQPWTLTDGDARCPYAAHGLRSTLPDLIRFAQMLVNGGELDGVRLLSEESVRLMFTNQLEESLGFGADIGLGWNLSHRHEESTGPGTYYMGNSHCGLFINPEERLVFAHHTPQPGWDHMIASLKPKAILLSALNGRGVPRAGAGAAEGNERQIDDRLAALCAGADGGGRLQGIAYSIWQGGEALSGAAGRRVYNREEALQPGDAGLVSSLTKLLTVIAVMQLVEDGMLGMAEPVKQWLKEFDTPMHGNIQVRHLLDHTSGIAPEPGLLGEPEPNGFWEYRVLYGEASSEQWIKAALTGPLHAQPGERRLYSTAGYLLLGEIVARVSGLPYEQFVRDRILEPLALHDTGFYRKREKRAETMVADEWQEVLLQAEGAGLASDPPRSGAGIYSTASDLLKLGLMLLGDGVGDNGARLLGASSVAYMKHRQFFGIPGLWWEGVTAEESFPLGGGAYPLRQMSFPIPWFHDVSVNAVLFVRPSLGRVSAGIVPSSIDWSPEALLEVKRLLC